MNKTSNYRLTIISPVFNEEGNIIRLAQTLDKYINSSEDKKMCVLFVNDGSADKSLEMIKEE